MSSPVPLQKDKHAKLKVTESSDFRRYKDKHLIPLVIQDFYTLASEFSLVFVKNNDLDEFLPVAIMGLRNGQNLYCRSEHWPAPVAPVNFGNSPFTIARTDDTGDQMIVLVDEESPLLSETTGEALFTESGERSEYLTRRMDALVKVAHQSEDMRAVCKFLADKKLLATQQVQLQHRPDAQRYNIDGIYTVDEKALNALSDEDFLQLRKQGLLALIYAHLASLQQLRRISQMQYEADKAAQSSQGGM